LGGYDCFRQDAMREWGSQQKNNRQRKRYYLKEYRQHFADAHVRFLYEQHRQKRQRKVIRQFGCYPAWNDFWHILDDVSTPLFGEALQNEEDHAMDELAESLQKKTQGLHPLNQSLYIETKTRLPGWILWKNDRLSMAHSVEARVPFMDHPLVELAAQIPPGLKLNGMDEKYILRKAMMSHLPEHPSQFKKRAFYTPIRDWFFTAERQSALQQYLSPAALQKTGYFREATVETYLQQIREAANVESMDDYYAVMKLEWLLLMVLSVQILHHLFVEKVAACYHIEL